jgi:phenylacetate-CoA ligase
MAPPSGLLAKSRRLLDPRYLVLRVRLGLERGRIRRGLARLAAFHRGAADDFRAERDARLTSILRYAERHSPYYRALFREAGVDARTGAGLERLPLLDKAIIRREGARLASDWLPSVPHFVMNTGGSTGEPLEFPAVGGIDPLHQDFFHRLIGLRPGERVLACDGTKVPDELRARRIYWVPKPDPTYGHFALSSHYLTDETAPDYLRGLAELGPALIRGYPSVIFELARRLLQAGRPPGVAPRAVVLTSESALPHQIEAIERAFSTRVHLQYGHSEACLFAYTADASRTYHCSPFYGLVEVVDGEGRPVAPGEQGEVVVTGFHTWAMPFIRYRTGDAAVYGGDDHGVVRLSSVAGRTQDLVVARDGQRVFVTALVFGCHYHAFAHVRRWLIVQERAGEVRFLIVRDAGYGPDDEAEIARTFERFGRITATFEYVDELPLTPRGKSKLLVQHLPV